MQSSTDHFDAIVVPTITGSSLHSILIPARHQSSRQPITSIQSSSTNLPPRTTIAALAALLFALPAIAASSFSHPEAYATIATSSPSYPEAYANIDVSSSSHPEAHVTIDSSITKASNTPQVKGDGIPVPTPEQARSLAAELKTYGTAIQTELNQCIAVPGENTAACFNRAKGMNLTPGKAMSPAQIAAATAKYSKLVGAMLGNCTKSKGVKTCLDAIKTASDNKDFSFDKRGQFLDFVNGFAEGFSSVFEAATPILTTVLPLLV
ncbi:hypothetical protein BJ878DRAFT_543715 [Calycina marina]|uniref:Uncharacterized protein n=1 Tax=Calycina marina TaxID=1763456 RepID=A0A9P7Z035_9HELO|nr:hypothetical protein BJ878DRAFT_543715 [Calycina marina]